MFQVEECVGWGQEDGNSLYFLLNFSLNLKLLYTIQFMILRDCFEICSARGLQSGAAKSCEALLTANHCQACGHQSGTVHCFWPSEIASALLCGPPVLVTHPCF